MRRWTLFLFVCTFTLQSALLRTVNAEGHYTVIGPGTLHSNRKYNVVVALHQTTEPATLKVGIVGEHYENLKTLELQPNVVQNVEFDVPILRPGDYNLTAEGVTGVIFKNTTKLNYNDFKPYVRIQTDKGKYKPGDVVNFRVLFLDENLKPATPDKNTTIWFEDGKRNRIKQFTEITPIKGVFTGKLQISEYPVLGKWRLCVNNGVPFPIMVTFDVSRYVLPKFTVNVEAPRDVSLKNAQMQVVVRANYTYGKPLDGKATIIAGLGSFYHFNNRRDDASTPTPKLILSTDMVKGKAKFDFNVQEKYDYRFLDFSTAPLEITATVEEQFTGVKLNGTATTRLHKNLYMINCALRVCVTFYPNNETDIIMRIVHVDGSLVDDTKSVVKLKCYEQISRSYFAAGEEKPPEIEHKVLSFESHLNASSLVMFKVTLDELTEFENYTHYYQMQVEFDGEVHNVTNAYQIPPTKPTDVTKEEEEKKEVKPEPYFLASVQYEGRYYTSRNISEMVTVLVNSSVPLSYFDYNIIGRGNILLSERVLVPDNAQVYNVTFEATFLMAPFAKFYAYYVDEEHNLQYTETGFSVNVELQNPLEITAPTKVKPGEDVALRIKTTPNSFVGLLAIDQSVLLLQNNNDIKPYDFKWRLNGYTTNTPSQLYTYPGYRAGVVTMTNANFSYDTIMYNRFGGVMPIASLGSSAHKYGAPTPASPPPPPQAVERVDVSSGSSVVPLRQDFAETWIFTDIENTETEEFTWTKKIPDTITSWVLTGFSLHPQKGLGVTADKTSILTFQPFFISVRLPYSVKRGEVFNVPALVFNYLDKDLDVEVTLDNSDGEYEFTEVTNEVIDTPKRSKTVRVPAYSSAGVSFMLRPKVVGNILLKYIAKSPIAGDAVHRTLKVVPEGVTKYVNRAFFVNLIDVPEFKESFALDFPADVVTDSEQIEFNVVGDLLGPILNNLDHLVRLPTGCAEQTMSAIVPNYLVYNYLKNTNKLTPALESKIKQNLETGYQRMLQNQLADGSYSTFIPQNATEASGNGSVWLTAYVLRSFLEMKEIVSVNDVMLSNGLDYLVRNQAPNGTFLENKNFTFGSHLRDHVAFTSSVLLTFVEDEELAKKYTTPVAKAIQYITENIEKTSSLYAKTLATYILFKTNNERKSIAYTQLEASQTSDGERNWWTENEQNSDKQHWWQWYNQRDVEITSYALLTKLMNAPKTIEPIVPIVKWLVAQRNNYGGFGSTQNTVWGLRALLNFAAAANYQAGVMDIEVTATGAKQQRETVKVTEESGLLTQSIELPHKTLNVELAAKGKGAALLQIAYQYNVLEEEQPAFRIVKTLQEGTPKHKLTLDVCVEYIGAGESTNMALLEVALPSGYVADVDAYAALLQVPSVRHYEFKNAYTHIVIYFESLTKGAAPCVTIEALRQFAVARQKPAAIVLYDYYDASLKATTFYEVASKLCDICDEDEECQKACQ